MGTLGRLQRLLGHVRTRDEGKGNVEEIQTGNVSDFRFGITEISNFSGDNPD